MFLVSTKVSRFVVIFSVEMAYLLKFWYLKNKLYLILNNWLFYQTNKDMNINDIRGF